MSPKRSKLLLEIDPASDTTADWRASEAKTARNLSRTMGRGARVQPGSGSSDYAKGDVKEHSDDAMASNRFLVECKSTEHASLGVKFEWLDKIVNEAMGMGLQPALLIEFLRARGVCEKRWVLVPESTFLRMKEDNHD